VRWPADGAARLPRSPGPGSAGSRFLDAAARRSLELWGLSWRVPEAGAARRRLQAAGLDVSEVRPGRKAGTRVFTVRDKTCGVPTLVLEAAPIDLPRPGT